MAKLRASLRSAAMHLYCSAVNVSLLLANLRSEEISVCPSAVGAKVRTPDLAGRGIDDETMIPCARNLITPDSVGRKGGSDAEGDQNANAQPNQYTFDIYFCVHKTL